MVLRRVSWNKVAFAQLEVACKHIKKHSLQNAIGVRKDILAKARSLETYSERYALDKYKIGNDGTYRYFEIHRLRVVYRVLPEDVKIISLRHASMNPLEY